MQLKWLVLVLAVTLPVAFLKAPPLVDVLGHIGRYELQTQLATDPWLQGFYTYKWQIIGNLGADVLVETAQPVLGTVGATRLAIMLVPILYASAVLLLSQNLHGRITPFAVVALALVYSLPFTWGFLNFSLAMAMALLAFALWLQLGPTRVRMALFIPLSLAGWLSHTFGWAFLSIVCGGESLARAFRRHSARPQTVRQVLAECWPLLMPLLPMLLWRSSAETAGIDGWFDMPQKASWLASVLRLQYRWLDLLCTAMIFAVLGAALLSRRIVLDRTIGFIALLAFSAFFILPKQIFGSVFADMRLAPYAVMLALLALRDTAAPSTRRLLMAAALAFLAVRLTLTAWVYYERSLALETHLGALSVVPEHARVATLVEIPCQSEWALPWFSHIGSMAIVRRHAFANDQWANSDMNPLHVRYPAAGQYATDNHQLVFPPRCGMTPTLRRSLEALPVRAFSHVWIVGVAPAAIPPRPDLQRLWHSRDAALFRVSSAGNEGPSTH